MSEYQEIKSYIDKIVNKQKPILVGLVALVAIIGGIFYLVNYFLPEREQEAQSELFMAQFAFEKEQYDLALNGEGKNKGFKYLTENYSFTKANKLAYLYRGVCELNLGKFDEAISSLKSFDSDLTELQAVAYNSLGDAYSEKDDMSQAVEYYKKAADVSPNKVLSPKMALKAGKALESNKNYEEAYNMYDRITQDYPNSEEAKIAEILKTQVENAK